MTIGKGVLAGMEHVMGGGGNDLFTGVSGEARFHRGVLQVDADGGADPEADMEIVLAKVKFDDLGLDADWLA